MQTIDFLRLVVTAPEGWLCIALKNNDFAQKWFRFPDQLEEAVQLATKSRDDHDVYFCPHLFMEQCAKKEYVLNTNRTIVSDLDYADTLKLPLATSVLVKTSSGRHQGYWILSDEPHDLELLSRKLTYAIVNSDLSGWTLGHKFRLPNTFNHKYNDSQLVEVVQAGGRTYESTDVDLLPEVKQQRYESDLEFVTNETPKYDVGPNILLETVKDKLPVSVYNQYNIPSTDRSKALWSLMCSAFRAGMDREQVLWLAYNSANNKFTGQRFNGNRDLVKDVLRAQAAVGDSSDDIREIITKIRHLGGKEFERNKAIYETVLYFMKTHGTFIATPADNYFVNGYPVEVDSRSQTLSNYITINTGLNPIEKEHRYVQQQLGAFVSDLPKTGMSYPLSFYDQTTNALLLHCGHRSVLRITTHEVEEVKNGSFGIVFPHITNFEPFAPSYEDKPSCWADSLFNESLTNIIGLTPVQAHALLRTWFLFIVFKSESHARPVLALFGQPGGGKSTLAKKVYALLYGRRIKLGGIRTPDDFDAAMSKYPLLILDNVDDAEKWLKDRFAQAAGDLDITKRKLYTNNDTYVLQKNAMLGVTAHDPKFVRPDVADRLLILTFKRIADPSHEEAFLSETDMLNRIYKRRNILWGHIVHDIQRILAIPRPADSHSILRIGDFVSLGTWFARALGYESDFISAIEATRSSQRSQVLDQDQILASAIITFTKKAKSTEQFRPTGSLYMELDACGGDDFRKIYRNAQALNKKLWVLQDALRELVNIEFRDTQIGREWRIWQK